MKWIDSVSEFFFHLWLLGGGGELFCQPNQSCWKLHEMDRFSLRIFFPSMAAGGGSFSASLTKVAEIA